MSEPAAPLRGVRVLSLAEQFPGPFASMILADLGADVILVERPTGGDPTRRFTGHFEALSRNKRSIVLDLKTRAGHNVFQRLLSGADVLMEGFRPGTMTRLGLGPDDVRRAYPSIVYASISSFGHTGPMSDRGGHDLSVQGMAGFVKRGADPTYAPAPVADLASAMYAALGIVTALLARKDTGCGTHLDVSMLDALVTWRSPAIVSALNGLDPAPYPPRDPGYGVFRVGGPGEHLITLSIAGEDHQWRALCEALELDALAGLTTAEREERADSIRQRLMREFADRDLATVEELLAKRNVGYGRVNADAGVAEDPQVRARDLIVEVGDQDPVRVVRQPLRFDGDAGVVRRRAPGLGEHTREVLAEIGMSNSDIDAYIASGGVVPDNVRT